MLTKDVFQNILVQLVVTYQFDYHECYGPVEVYDHFKRMHEHILTARRAREEADQSGGLVVRKGLKSCRKHVGGLEHPLELGYVSFLLCVPGMSEKKALGVVRAYPTLRMLIEELKEVKEVKGGKKLNALADVEIGTSYGDEKAKRLGPTLARRIMSMFVSVDETITIN